MDYLFKWQHVNYDMNGLVIYNQIMTLIVFTAHHTDDNIETFIINLSRGSNIHALSGIPEKNDKIIRPLLIFDRDELLNYAINSKLKWREDSSNSSL